MNTPLNDLELPPAPLPDYWWWLAMLVIILLLAGVVWYWRKRQHPIARALRQLDRLPDDPASLPQLAAIIRLALGGISLPFFQRLDHARFSPTTCTPATFASLKREARALLEQAR